MCDTGKHMSKCGRHVMRITQCKETGKIYDEGRCLIFKDEKDWKMAENGNNNVGEKMECLVSYLKQKEQIIAILHSKTRGYDETKMGDSIKRDSRNIVIDKPPPDG